MNCLGDSSGAILQLDENRFFVANQLHLVESFKDSLVDEQLAENCAVIYAPTFFFNKEAPVTYLTQEFAIFTREELLSSLLKKEIEKPFLSWREPEKSRFTKYFEEAQKAFGEEDLKKVVPVVFAKSTYEFKTSHLLFVLKKLLDSSLQTVWIYGLWLEKRGFLGATPELLFRQSPGKPQIESMALAGTLPLKDKAQREPLLKDQKELSEHQWVVDDIRKKFLSLGEVQVEETKVLNLPTLEHLKTSIFVEPSRDYSFSELMKVMHPTPALGGVPSEQTDELLRKWNLDEERETFGAPFGLEWSDGQGIKEKSCVVGIRNMDWCKKEGASYSVRLGSGCGLVQASQLEQEWQELFAKRKSVLKMMGLD